MGARHAITALAGLAFVVCAIQFGAFAALRGAIAQRPASARSRLREKQPGRGGEDSWAEALRGWDPTLEPDPPGDTDLPETGRKQGERRRRDEDETRSTAAAEGKREGMGTAPAGCARVRSGRLLLYAAHSGVGNQELSLRRALLLAYALNRTLVLPPLLRQSDLAFGPPERRCSNNSVLVAQTMGKDDAIGLSPSTSASAGGGVSALPGMATLHEAAERIYLGKLSAGARGADTYESLMKLYDFSELRAVGMRFVDFGALVRRIPAAGGSAKGLGGAAVGRLAGNGGIPVGSAGGPGGAAAGSRKVLSNIGGMEAGSTFEVSWEAAESTADTDEAQREEIRASSNDGGDGVGTSAGVGSSSTSPSEISEASLQRAQEWLRGAGVLHSLPCGRGEKMTVADVRARLRREKDVPLLRISSVYFAKVQFAGLRKTDPCFAAVVRATLRLPFTAPILAAGRAAVRRLPKVYASVHLRAPDDYSALASASPTPATSGARNQVQRAASVLPAVAYPSSESAVEAVGASASGAIRTGGFSTTAGGGRLLLRASVSDDAVTPAASSASRAGGGSALELIDNVLESVTWLKRRLLKRAPPDTVSLFIATNLPNGARSAELEPLCTTPAANGGREGGKHGKRRLMRGLYNCTDVHSLRLSSQSSIWSPLARTSLSEGSATLAVEMVIAASAPKGFFSTSKFCGPVGYRRSTLSESIAQRWAVEHDADVLCANALEYALMQGMTAHGSQVY